MRTPPGIGDYLIQRLYDHGVRHVFGIPGDYVLFRSIQGRQKDSAISAGLVPQNYYPVRRTVIQRRFWGSSRHGGICREQSIIPAFAAKIGIAREALPELSGYYVNARQTPSSFG